MGTIDLQCVTSLIRCGMTLLVLAWLALAVHAGPTLSLAHRYPGPWAELTQGVRDVLELRKVTACSWAMARQSARHPGDYLLYCSSDAQHWTRWRVQPAAQKVRGPGDIVDGIPPPNSDQADISLPPRHTQ
jgi:hypothetical protein